MTERTLIQNYINNFRRRIARFLKPGIGLVCNIYQANSGGAILEFLIGPGIKNDDIYKEASPTLGSALSNIEQHAFGGNLNGFVFGGTNLIMEGNRIVLIKDGNASEWSDEAAETDLSKILPKNNNGRVS